MNMQAFLRAYASAFSAFEEEKVAVWAWRIDPLLILMTKAVETEPSTKEQSVLTLYQFSGGFVQGREGKAVVLRAFEIWAVYWLEAKLQAFFSVICKQGA